MVPTKEMKFHVHSWRSTHAVKRVVGKGRKKKKVKNVAKKVDVNVEIGKLFLVVLPNGIYDVYVSSQKWLI